MIREDDSMGNVMETTTVKVPSIAELEIGLQCDFKRAQDMRTAAFHVQGLGGKVLCDATDIFLGTKVLTVEGVLLSLGHQNGAWFWCVDCGAAFTGLDKETFTQRRFQWTRIH